MEKSSQQVCQEFHRNPTINPRSGSRIQPGKGTYLQLVKECGQPPAQGIFPGMMQPTLQPLPGFPQFTGLPPPGQQARPAQPFPPFGAPAQPTVGLAAQPVPGFPAFAGLPAQPAAQPVPGFPAFGGLQTQPLARPPIGLPPALTGLPAQPLVGLPGAPAQIPLPQTVPGLPGAQPLVQEKVQAVGAGPIEFLTRQPIGFPAAPPVIAPSAMSPAVSPVARPPTMLPIGPQIQILPSQPQIQILPSQIQARPPGAVPAALIIIHSSDGDYLYLVPRDAANTDLIEEAIRYATGASDVESDEYDDFEDSLGEWSARDIGGVIRNANIDIVVPISKDIF